MSPQKIRTKIRRKQNSVFFAKAWIILKINSKACPKMASQLSVKVNQVGAVLKLSKHLGVHTYLVSKMLTLVNT